MRAIHNILLLCAVLLVFGAAGCGKGSERLTGTDVTRTEGDTKAVPAPDSTPPAESSPHAVGSMDDDYILPEAQTYVYTQEELKALTREELRVARNEIYARHGRKFKAADLEAHFARKEWYRPSVESDRFDEAVLSRIERDNLKAVIQAEEAIAGEVISCPKIGAEEFPVIDGSTATLPISQAIYRLATGSTKREAEEVISHYKTSNAYENLMAGRGVNLVIAYAPGDEMMARINAEDQIILKPIGRDALVFLANKENAVNSLSQKQIVDIYSGKITSWKTLGGKNMEIKAFQRPKNAGSQNLMEKLVMKNTAMAEAPGELTASEMGDLIDQLSVYDNTSNALGYSVYYYAKNMYQKPNLKFMAVDGVMPSGAAIRDGSYPYVNDFYAAVRSDEPKDSAAYRLFEWLTSDDGQALINALGYVGTEPVEKELPAGFEDGDVFGGKIPLAAGTVILGDGDYLYGESGVAVFDGSMKLEKFIPHVNAVGGMVVFDENSLLRMSDMATGDMGLYSLKENRWVCSPKYDAIWEEEDGGYGMGKKWLWTGEEEGDGRWTYTCDFADQSGRLTETEVQLEEAVGRMKQGYPDLDPTPEEFAKRYPEVLKKHGVVADALSIRWTGTADPFMVIRKGGREYYYNIQGTFLMEFDEKWIGHENSRQSPVVINDHVSYIWSSYWSENGEKYMGDKYFVFRDGLLVKELETAEDYIVFNDGFYIRDNGNYRYIYNYEDELCAKFLNGFYADD